MRQLKELLLIYRRLSTVHGTIISLTLTALTIGQLIGCGGAPTPTTEPASAAESATPAPEESTRARFAGPRLRVVFGEFQIEGPAQQALDAFGWRELGPVLGRQSLKELIEAGYAMVLERARLGEVVDNLAMEQNAELFAQETVEEQGQFYGAQAVLVGSLDTFEPNVSQASGGLSVPGLAGLTTHHDRAEVKISLRVVDQRRGEVLAAGSGTGSIRTSSSNFNLTALRVGLNAGWQSRTPLGQATGEALQNALRTLQLQLQAQTWRCPVTGGRGRRVFIQCGDGYNLYEGTTLRLWHRGEAILGPDGTAMGYDSVKGPLIQIKSIQERMSIAEFPEGSTGANGEPTPAAVAGDWVSWQAAEDPRFQSAQEDAPASP